MKLPRNALGARLYGYRDEDPAEMPPEGFIEGENGPPDQYIPQDEMDYRRNALVQPIASRSGGRRTASDASYDIETQLREMAADPRYQTDEGIVQIMTLAHQHGVRSPFDRAFNEPPGARANALAPSGLPRPLMRGQDEYRDERGGRGAFWDDNDPSVYEPQYQRQYGRR